MRKRLNDLFIRLLSAFIVSLNYNWFYTIFSLPTLHFSRFLSSFFVSSTLAGTSLLINNYNLKFVDACTAGAAYLLITLLMLLTPKVSLKKRLKVLILGYALIFIFNIIRIELLLFILFHFSKNLFEKVHMFIWQILSTVVVFLIWLYLVRAFKIRSIPVYSDYKYLIKTLKKSKK